MGDTLTCLHSTHGLCPACQVAYDTDPLAYIEYGLHPEGKRRWEALLKEVLDARAARDDLVASAGDDEIPF